MPALISIVVRIAVYLGAMLLGSLGATLWHFGSLWYTKSAKEREQKRREEMLQRKK